MSNLTSHLFGETRTAILAALLLRPERQLHVRELARLTGISPGTLHRELTALEALGVLCRQRVGNQVQFQANPACPVFEELRGIMKKTAGIADILREALAPIAEIIDVAFVFGSVARGDERAGSDLDVMVIGGCGFADVVGALAPVHELLGREINPNVYPAKEFREKLAAGEPFVRRVLADEKIFLIGDESDLGELAANRKAQAPRRRRA